MSSSAELAPSLKGTSLSYAVNRLLIHRETGKLTDDLLDSRLSVEDRAMLENPVRPTLWYPIDNFNRLMLLLREIEGGDDDEWWVRYGVESAADILGFAPVQIILKGARAFGPRAGKALVKMSSLYFNVGRWEFDGESMESYTVEVSEAEGLSDICRLISLGFLRYVTQQFVGREVEILSSRPTPDRIIYRTVP